MIEHQEFDPYCAAPYYLAFENIPGHLSTLDRFLLHVLMASPDARPSGFGVSKTISASPGVGALARRSGLSTRSVLRGLQRLADRRLIIIVSGDKSTKMEVKTNTYLITPVPFVLYAERLTLAKLPLLLPSFRHNFMEQANTISRSLIHALGTLQRLPARTKRVDLSLYWDTLGVLETLIEEFEMLVFGSETQMLARANSGDDSASPGVVTQCHSIRNIGDMDLKFSEIINKNEYFDYKADLNSQKEEIKTNTNGWMINKSAPTHAIEQDGSFVNIRFQGKAKVTPLAVSLAKDVEDIFAARNGFIDWRLLNGWMADIIECFGADYARTLSVWLRSFWESRERRSMRLTISVLNRLAKLFADRELPEDDGRAPDDRSEND